MRKVGGRGRGGRRQDSPSGMSGGEGALCKPCPSAAGIRDQVFVEQVHSCPQHMGFWWPLPPPPPTAIVLPHTALCLSTRETCFSMPRLSVTPKELHDAVGCHGIFLLSDGPDNAVLSTCITAVLTTAVPSLGLVKASSLVPHQSAREASY